MKTLQGLLVFALGAVSVLRLAGQTNDNTYDAVDKARTFDQVSLNATVPDPSAPFGFDASTPVAMSFTPPSGSVIVLPEWVDSGSSGYEFSQSFATQAALDGAFPNGNYACSVSGTSNFTLSLTGDLYPNAPTITNGTWNSSGQLVIDSTKDANITFNRFTGYATSAAISQMEIQITSYNGKSVNLDQAYVTSINPSAFTSYLIPAGSLRPGSIYQCYLVYNLGIAQNTAVVSGNVALISMYTATTNFTIVTSGTASNLPTIAQQPTSQQAALNSTVTFIVGVNGNGNNFSVHWFKNGIPITNNQGSSNNLTLPNVQSSDAGNYFVVVTPDGGVGYVQSNTVTLSVGSSNPSPPTITAQPAAQSVNAGASPVLSVATSGATGYQWQLSGTNIAGATNSTLTLSSVGTAQRGAYAVIVSNPYGSVTSNAANVTVSVNSFLYNISTVGYVGSGANQDLDAGFYTNGSGSKNIVVRGIGPNLAALDAKDYSGLVLTNPQLVMNSASSVLSTTTAWGGSQTLVNAFATVYAASFPSGSSDAAVFTSVPAGPGIGYTADVKSANGGTGVAQIEVYDYDSYVTAPASRLINISTRGYVGTGLGTGAAQFQFLDAGFWTIGSTSETLLIRAVGPAEAANFPTQYLAKPLLTLYDSSGKVIATNSGWGTAPGPGNSAVAAGILPATTAIMNSVYASTIAAGSNDCAMVVTLPANNGYTAKVTSADSASTGIALVEVYDIP